VDADDTEQRFVNTMRGWLISLPHDLKILYEASTDENLDDKVREIAVGAIIYILSPHEGADRRDFTGFGDDCVLLRLALRQIARDGGEDAEFLKGRFAEFFDALDAELDAVKPAMGDLFPWLESRLPHFTELVYKGNKVPKYLTDDAAGEVLYEDGLAFATAYPVDDKRLSDKFKKASTLLEVMSRRKADVERKAR
jgi:hypothetical protein